MVAINLLQCVYNEAIYRPHVCVIFWNVAAGDGFVTFL